MDQGTTGMYHLYINFRNLEIWISNQNFSLLRSPRIPGMPKAATLSHFNLANNSRFFGERIGFKQYFNTHGRTARVCLPVPIFHAFGKFYFFSSTYYSGSRYMSSY